MVEPQLPKLMTWVRFPSPAPLFTRLMLLLWLTSDAALADYVQYPFDAPADYLAPAGEMSGWAATLARHADQRAWLADCSLGERRCRGRVRSLAEVLERGRSLSETDQISLVNYYINRTKYKDDRPQRLYDAEGNKLGVMRSSWTTLYDFLTKGGDCEDYATAKYFMLRELGWSAERLKVVVVWEIRERGYHGLLAVKQADGSVWLLDSDNRIKKKSHRGYRYLYAMNEHSVWDHQGADAPARGR